jgi:putative transposase
MNDNSYLGDHKDRPYGTMYGSLGRIVQAFKSRTTVEYIMGIKKDRWVSFNGQLWQRSFYARIIRNESELNQIRRYIINNPIEDHLNM